MRSRAHEVQVVTIDLINEEPIRLDVTFAEALPFTTERMVLQTLRQHVTFDQ
jgi:hypothetical protein